MNAVDYFVVVPSFPASGNKIEVGGHQVLTGGQTATAMTALARLGYKTRYQGRVGDDEAGRIQRESLESVGVDISHLKVIEGGASSVSFIIVEQQGGERTILWRRGVSTSIDPDDVERDYVTSGRVLHIDGHSIAAETKGARFAREAGIPVVIDVDKDYGGDSLYGLVDYLVTASEFPSRMTGIADDRAALAALHERYGCSVVAMTLGKRGALAYCEGTYVESPGFAVEACDTTGAGDAFHGGFIFGMLEGHSLEDTLRVANAVAALNCTKLGARGGLPTREELSRFLGE